MPKSLSNELLEIVEKVRAASANRGRDMNSMQATELAPSKVTGAVAKQVSKRVASIDWMRGVVMVFMVLDHASMAFDAHHLDKDSALYANAATMPLPAAEFFTRWLTHLCAPAFVFLMGTALALSVERRVVKGANAWDIDKGMLKTWAVYRPPGPNPYIAWIGSLDISSIARHWAFYDLHGPASAFAHLGSCSPGRWLDWVGGNRYRMVLDTAGQFVGARSFRGCKLLKRWNDY